MYVTSFSTVLTISRSTFSEVLATFEFALQSELKEMFTARTNNRTINKDFNTFFITSPFLVKVYTNY